MKDLKDLNYLFNLIEQSSVTLIGYSYKSETVKDNLLSKLNVYNIGKIDINNFNPKQIIRDAKLSMLFEEKEYSKYYHIDINDVGVRSTLTSPKDVSFIVNSIRNEIWHMYNNYSINEESDLGLDFDDYENHEQKNIIPPFNLIVTTQTYKSPIDDYNFKGIGTRILYSADLAFSIKDISLKQKLIGDSNSVKIIKNRFDTDEFIDNFEISLNNLDNYNYICNYEYSK